MIGKTGILALKALAVLANLPPGSYAGAGDIARKLKAPKNYLGKLLQSLAQQGVVTSQKGTGGGFQLACDPQSTNLFQILDPIEHVSRWEGCFLGRKACSKKSPCAVHRRWEATKKSYLRFLKETRIADLIK
jgi:Rrf2 family nitric oxide-sensitive transcriptional repressor